MGVLVLFNRTIGRRLAGWLCEGLGLAIGLWKVRRLPRVFGGVAKACRTAIKACLALFL
jgi:hypothetical protein